MTVPGRLAPLAAELGAPLPRRCVRRAQCAGEQQRTAGRRPPPAPPRRSSMAAAPSCRRCGASSLKCRPTSFFQTSAGSAALLYDLIVEAADLGPADTVVDLFTGTGTIGLALAASAGRVLGVELVADAVADARRNAARNGVTNAAFYVGDLTALRGGMALADVVDWEGAPPPMVTLPAVGGGGGGGGGDAAAANGGEETAAKGGEATAANGGEETAAKGGEAPAAKADVRMDVVVRRPPPGPGLHPKLVRWLARCGARRLVYVSCNAATQVRDVALLRTHEPRWQLTALTPVDMFPHTPHVETVGVLELVGEPRAVEG
eukprot:TRINITY_DN833_c0_g1_i1.p2 TRINITY_DN833_c0_g1~~TRINITY_DN833_c0_g1_i1.p2  ORF type:complete len:319 (-),score=111.62 TRINITY_DN833_c0_g1_i1:42-998(-)